MRWTRKLSKEFGMNQTEFSMALLMAFKDEEVKKSLVELVARAITGPVSQKVSENVKNEVVKLRAELQHRDLKIKQLEEKVESLTADIDQLEQYSRRNSLRITGIPETDEEDPVSKVMDLVNNTLQLNPPLELSEVDRVHRSGKPRSNLAPNQPAKPRAILVKMATYRSRKRIMDLRSSRLLQKGVFFNEDLTKRRESLCYKARCLKREGKIQSAWSADGNILIRDKHGNVRKINTQKELETLN